VGWYAHLAPAACLCASLCLCRCLLSPLAGTLALGGLFVLLAVLAAAYAPSAWAKARPGPTPRLCPAPGDCRQPGCAQCAINHVREGPNKDGHDRCRADRRINHDYYWELERPLREAKIWRPPPQAYTPPDRPVPRADGGHSAALAAQHAQQQQAEAARQADAARQAEAERQRQRIAAEQAEWQRRQVPDRHNPWR
jgi:signal transduction histidine kinase